MKNRVSWLDFGKGFTVLLVVLGHVLLGLFESKRFMASNHNLLVVIEFIYIFHIPVFFALSGYFFKAIANTKSYVDYVIKKFVALSVPYLFYSIVQFSLQTIGGNTVRRPAGLNDLLMIYQKPLGVSWYLYTLFFVYLYLGLLSLFIKNKRYIFYISGLGFLIALVFPIPIYIVQKVLLWSFFFMLGSMLREVKISDWSLKRSFTFSSFLSLIILSSMFIWILAKFKFYTSYDTPGLWGLMFISSVPLAFIVYQKLPKQNAIFKYFERVGKDSLVIYILHAPIVSVTRIFLFKVGVHWLTIHIILGLAIGWFGSYIALMLFKKIPYIDFIFYPSKYLVKNKVKPS